jgi:creatinine amidohydrolase
VSKKPVLVDQMSFRQLEELVQSGRDMVILPVGAVEQHSLHMPLNVDYIVADEIGKAVSARTGVPMLPTMPYGCSSNHRGFAGTFSLKPQTLQLVLEELAGWIYDSGFRRLVFLNANFPNQFPMQCAIPNIGERYPDLWIRTLNWWDINNEVRDWVYSDESYGRIHAAAAETSIFMHLRPDLVDLSKAYPEPGKGTRFFFHYPHICVSKTGHQGDPTKANAEDGKRMFDKIVEVLSRMIDAAQKETAPYLKEALTILQPSS